MAKIIKNGKTEFCGETDFQIRYMGERNSNYVLFYIYITESELRAPDPSPTDELSRLETT
jgi:hypothetical protein